MPDFWWVFHWSKSSAIRAEDCFHCVRCGSWAAICSASATIASRAATFWARCASWAARSAASSSRIAGRRASSRDSRALTSPSILRWPTCSARWSTVLCMSAEGAPAATRCSSSATCASTSSNFRAK